MAKEDYYKTLGVDKNVDEKQLKSAYRKAAMKYHPDRNPDDKVAEKKFKELSEAYEVLKDPQKRAAYDQYGHAAFEQGGMGGAGGGFGGFDFRGGSANEYASSFADIFEDLFGGAFGGGGRQRGGARVIRGNDLRYNMKISLEEAFNGIDKQISITNLTTCDSCGGKGTNDGSEPETCTTCGGAGRVRVQQGFFAVEQECTSCAGTGKQIKNPCRKCGGDGRVRQSKKLNVNIPAGIEDGQRIRLSGEGEAGPRGGPAGDLYIFVDIAPHKLLVREVDHLHCEVPIKMTMAALGGEIEVPTIDGSTAKVKIPAGTQSGARLRLKNKGMSVLRSSIRGDMYIHVVVETPRDLSKRQKEILSEYSETEGKKNNPDSESFFKKVKGFISSVAS